MMTHTVIASLAAFGACIELPPGDMKDPQYWGDVFLDHFEAERTAAMDLDTDVTVPEPLAQPRTVLLITGVTIPAEWFDPIKARLVRDGFNPVVWEPPALLSGSLYENSERLGDVVQDILAETGEAKIDILAECTGGVIARHYIQSLGGDQFISRMVTFISPQHGVEKAPFAHSIVGWEALRDLSPGSDFLEAVNSAPLPDNVPFTSIYTCDDEYIRPYETSIIPGATNIGIGCDSEFVGHYQFFYDPEIYLVMHDALMQPVPADDDTPSDDPNDEPVDPSLPENGVGGCSAGGSSGAGGMLILATALALSRRRRA